MARLLVRCIAVAVLLLAVAAVPPVMAEEPPAGDAARLPPRAAESETPTDSCSACTGSAVKSWRIRKGDPKRPAPTKSLRGNDKETDRSDLAE